MQNTGGVLGKSDGLAVLCSVGKIEIKMCFFSFFSSASGFHSRLCFTTHTMEFSVVNAYREVVVLARLSYRLASNSCSFLVLSTVLPELVVGLKRHSGS